MTHLDSQERSALLPALQSAQATYGYIPEDVASEIARTLGVPLADVFGVIEFYSMLYSKPVGKRILRVCTDPACSLAGGEQVLSTICHKLGLSEAGTMVDGEYTVERAPCLGLCEHAPAALVNEQAAAPIAPEEVDGLLRGEVQPVWGVLGGEVRILTARCGYGKRTDLEAYRSAGGYQGLEKALMMTPMEVIEELKASGLVGRGGAAFPTGIKWDGAAHAPGEPKYVVCNADESEPGTFKDRVLLEEDPHSILEGMLIAAHAIGAQKGYIYVRGEYPKARLSLDSSLLEARAAGLLGEDILGRGLNFDVELRSGAGAYICGEETALFESIEGKRGFPRLKPPFPTTNGLFGKPTVINNVETLANVPYIMEHGAALYRKLGTLKSPGSKLFCLSGDISRPGLYEVPFGVPLCRLIDLAGGVRGGRNLKSILFGGAAGAFATPDQLDVPLSFEDLRQAGLPLGSGVVMVFDETREMPDVLTWLARFFAHESCGKCYPCQLGTQRQYEILQRISAGQALPGDAARLSDVGWTMTDASICGLGQTAASAILSALKIWPELFH